MLLHHKQKPIAQSDARFKVIRAGRRSGKTAYEVENMLFKAVAKAIRLARAIPNRAVIYIAPTQKQARTIVWEAFRSRLGKIGEYNEARLEIKIPTEDGGTSTIFIGGWENRENYRGMPNVVHITFDELDTMRDFFVSWQEIFRPMLIDTGGSADFIGTPKKENPNLRRLEKEAAEEQNKTEWAFFHFTTADNPHIPASEIEKARLELDADTYRQEILAEYVDNLGALFHYDALVDVFINAVEPSDSKFLIVDIADDGSDKTVFSLWHGLEEYGRERRERMNTESIVARIREIVQDHAIPMAHVAVDAIGVGAGVASSSFLDGIIGYKSSYGPINTDMSPVRLPNIHYTKTATLTSEYKNLRSQCIFTLADYVNNHRIASKANAHDKARIIEELSAYQDASRGDGKRMATQKEDVKDLIGRSPDDSDTWIMRMYFEIRGRLLPGQSEEWKRIMAEQSMNFSRVANAGSQNSSE